jgi:GNAT superfamily N-acetyltransferase
MSVEATLTAYLNAWLGRWPPASRLTVVGEPGRTRPGWDGAVRDVLGVGAPDGAVVSVPPERQAAVDAVATAWADLPAVLPAAVGRPEAMAFLGAFRWSSTPADLPDAGVWVPAGDPRLPAWLAPFRGQVLVALDDGRYAAGVGLKRHNRYGVEVAVGTEPEYRGRGLAARLCAQAARHILAGGAVPIYLHDPANTASARTAAAAGFPDQGWQVLGMTPAPDQSAGGPGGDPAPGTVAG